MRLVLLHIQCPIYKLEKGAKGPMIFFGGGGGGIGLRLWGIHYYFKRGTFSQQQKNT